MRVTRGETLHIHAHPTKNLIVYPCRKAFVVRDLDNPKASFVYRGHEYKTTVAKFSPNGNYNFWEPRDKIQLIVQLYNVVLYST